MISIAFTFALCEKKPHCLDLLLSGNIVFTAHCTPNYFLLNNKCTHIGHLDIFTILFCSLTPERLGSTVVTCSPLTTTDQVLLSLWAACRMSFTFHSQCLVVVPSGFSCTLRRSQNCSVWNHLIRPTGLARLVLGDIKSMTLHLQQCLIQSS